MSSFNYGNFFSSEFDDVFNDEVEREIIDGVIGDIPVRVITNPFALRAESSVIAMIGFDDQKGISGTCVHCVVSRSTASEDMDYFPLNVNYYEPQYSCGRIPRNFMKREGKQHDSEILRSRALDRAIRPCFHEAYCDSTCISLSVLNYDGKNSPYLVSDLALNVALHISSIPMRGCIGAARIIMKDSKYTVNPLRTECKDADLDVAVASIENRVHMIECASNSIDHNAVLDAIRVAHDITRDMHSFVSKFKDGCLLRKEYDDELQRIYEFVNKSSSDDIQAGFDAIRTNLCDPSLVRRTDAFEEYLSKIHVNLMLHLESEEVKYSRLRCSLMLRKIVSRKFHEFVKEAFFEDGSGVRIDGRKCSEVRKIRARVGGFSNMHGCALFRRGNTSVLSSVTLGTERDSARLMTSIEGDYNENFYLHYNFPPYSVGEAAPSRAPSRREVGHGRLAQKALENVVYRCNKSGCAVRVVCDTMSSDGSSSQASVCASSLALMSSGIINEHVAGIAMGVAMSSDGNDAIILSDISGAEDGYGGMDFKVSSTQSGITAIQMDAKKHGLSIEDLNHAIEQSADGLSMILESLNDCLSECNVSNTAVDIPKSVQHAISPRIAKALLSESGKQVKYISRSCNVNIDIDRNSGTVRVRSSSEEDINSALEMIKALSPDNISRDIKVHNIEIMKRLEFGFRVRCGDMIGIMKFADCPENLPGIGEYIQAIVISDERDNCVTFSSSDVDQVTGEILLNENSNMNRGDSRNKHYAKPKLRSTKNFHSASNFKFNENENQECDTNNKRDIKDKKTHKKNRFF